MMSCREYRDLFWDLAYGLLEADQSERVRAHAATCPSCQAELQQIEAQQQRMRRALRRDLPVPLFVAPESDVLPLRPHRPERRRPWTQWAAAAVLLLAAGLAYGVYANGLSRREADYAGVQERLAAVLDQRAELRRELSVAFASVVRSAQDQSLRLQVYGPQQYHPGGANDYRVLTTNLSGQQLPAQVTIRLVGKEGRTVYESKDQASQGNLLVSLPASLSREEVETGRLEFLARGTRELAQVGTALGFAEPAYTTHLALSKPVYRPGEVVLARSVTLERFRLRPPDNPLKITYLVTGPSGMPKRLTGLTHEGGVGMAEFAVKDRSWPDGEYTLTVSDERDRFPPQSCKFYVRTPQAVRLRQEIELDRGSYKPGDTVKAQLRARRLDNSQPAAGEAVTATLYVDGKPVGKPIDLRTDATGMAGFQIALPGNVAVGAARLSVLTGQDGERDLVVKAVPVLVPRVLVEFFPEGGDLLADVPNRVYIRARNSLGQPIDLRGRVHDGQGQEVLSLDLTGSRGLGTFTLKPRAGETYSFQVTAPEGIAERTPLPEVHTSRVGLHVPTGVTRHTEPIRATLHHTGPPRPILVGVFCRGRLVAQEQVTVRPGGTEVQLLPTAGSAGVLRVTVFDPHGPQPVPVAERLVYRVPGEALQLALTPHQDRYQPGDRVRLDLHSRDERNDVADAWLAVVVLHDSAHDARSPNHRAYFHLLSDVRQPDDLEQVEIALRGDPQALAALDLFLGTQGWRRFAPAGERPPPPKEDAILKLDTFEQAERKFADELAKIGNPPLARDRELEEDQSQLLEEADAAALALQSYRERAARGLAIGVRAALLVVFAGAGAYLLWSLARVLRGGMVRRPVIAGAVACLLLVTAGWLGMVDRFDGKTEPVTGHQAHVAAVKDWPASPALATLDPLPPVAPERLNGGNSKVLVNQVPVLLAAGERTRTPSYLRGTNPVLAPFKPMPVPVPSASALPVRVYAYELPREPAAEKHTVPEVLLWHPYLRAAEGTARVEFDLPRQGGTYQVLIHGHTPNGRLGVLQRPLGVESTR